MYGDGYGKYWVVNQQIGIIYYDRVKWNASHVNYYVIKKFEPKKSCRIYFSKPCEDFNQLIAMGEKIIGLIGGIHSV